MVLRLIVTSFIISYHILRAFALVFLIGFALFALYGDRSYFREKMKVESTISSDIIKDKREDTLPSESNDHEKIADSSNDELVASNHGTATMTSQTYRYEVQYELTPEPDELSNDKESLVMPTAVEATGSSSLYDEDEGSTLKIEKDFLDSSYDHENRIATSGSMSQDEYIESHDADAITLERASTHADNMMVQSSISKETTLEAGDITNGVSSSISESYRYKVTQRDNVLSLERHEASVSDQPSPVAETGGLSLTEASRLSNDKIVSGNVLKTIPIAWVRPPVNSSSGSALTTSENLPHENFNQGMKPSEIVLQARRGYSPLTNRPANGSTQRGWPSPNPIAKRLISPGKQPVPSSEPASFSVQEIDTIDLIGKEMVINGKEVDKSPSREEIGMTRKETSPSKKRIISKSKSKSMTYSSEDSKQRNNALRISSASFRESSSSFGKTPNIPASSTKLEEARAAAKLRIIRKAKEKARMEAVYFERQRQQERLALEAKLQAKEIDQRRAEQGRNEAIMRLKVKAESSLAPSNSPKISRAVSPRSQPFSKSNKKKLARAASPRSSISANNIGTTTLDEDVILTLPTDIEHNADVMKTETKEEEFSPPLSPGSNSRNVTIPSADLSDNGNSLNVDAQVPLKEKRMHLP